MSCDCGEDCEDALCPVCKHYSLGCDGWCSHCETTIFADDYPENVTDGDDTHQL